MTLSELLGQKICGCSRLGHSLCLFAYKTADDPKEPGKFSITLGSGCARIDAGNLCASTPPWRGDLPRKSYHKSYRRKKSKRLPK